MTAETALPPAGVDETDLDWLMTGFKRKVPGVLHAIAVTADGFHLASTPGIDPAARLQLCAITSGIASLTTGLASLLDEAQAKHALVDMERGVLMVASISDGSALAVLSTHKADLGMVAYEAQMLVKRVGLVLTPAVRERLTAGARR